MTKRNPYTIVARLKRQRQALQKWVWWMQGVLVVVVALLLREPLSIYLLSNTTHRLEQLLFRTGAVLVAITALQTYNDVVRHPERSIFGIHPVRATKFLTSVSVEQCKHSMWYAVLAIGIWTGVSPEWLPWIVGYVGSAWLGGLGAGYAVHLGSVWAATSKQMEGVLDSIRGENPRAQAAFIYAPGVALAIIGVALIFGAGATRLAIEGKFGFAAWILSPMIIGLLGWFTALRLANVHLIRAGMILADIDAHWNIVEDSEDKGAVYLDWLAKRNPHRLRLLRQSWRLHRWVTLGLWVVGGVTALMHWVGDGFEVLLVSGFVSTAFLLYPSKLLEYEPQWLQWSLAIDTLTQWRAITETAALIWLSFLIPMVIAQFFIGEMSYAWLAGASAVVPLCGVVGWLELNGRKTIGLAAGMLISACIWIAVIGVGG